MMKIFTNLLKITNMENTATSQTPTHKFDFDINKISLEDLRALYNHFGIYDFADADSANDLESFFKCFVEDEDFDGNKDAYLLIRFAALFSSGVAKIIDVEYESPVRGIKTCSELGFYTNYSVDFDAGEYFHFAEDGFHIVIVYWDYDIEAAIPILEKYNFLKPQIYFEA